MENREIERKWLFNTMHFEDKGIELIEECLRSQGYISIEPEIRVSRKRNFNCEIFEHILTIKSKGSLDRIEIEKPLTEKEFNDLLIVGGLTEKDLIEKHYKKYKLGKYELVVGEADLNRPTKFIYGEVEFPTIEEAIGFTPLDWFGEDVTDDNSYKMSNYWRRTRSQKSSFSNKGKLGGIHDQGEGWNPQGVWCGERNSSTCVGCKSANVEVEEPKCENCSSYSSENLGGYFNGYCIEDGVACMAGGCCDKHKRR